MSRRTLTLVFVVLALALLGWVAHSFDLLGAIKALHGGGVPAH